MDPIPAPAVRRMGRFILALLCTGAVAAGMAQVTTDTFDLVGPVATITEFQEYPGTTERNVFQTLAFRADGTALERVYFAYSYMDGSLRSRNATTYDEMGKRLAAVTMDPDGNPLAQTVFRYDDRGNLVEEASYDAEGTETRRVTYERNADGNVVAWEVYLRGELDERNEIDYDAQGHPIEAREYEDGRLTEVETYTEPGSVSEVVAYDDEGQVESTRTVVESAHGTERMEIFDADGNLEWEMTWAHDENGLLLERSTVDGSGEGEVYTYGYEFDETGNWIRMVVTEFFGDMEPTTYEIRDREITYH